MLFIFLVPKSAKADSSDVVFDDSQVLTFELEFDDPDWFDSLAVRWETGEYYPGRFIFQGQVYDSVGIRFKGFSSYLNYPGVKKPFKVSFNEYFENQTFYGLKKINLNNCHKDPTMMREKLAIDLFNAHIPSMRGNHVNLYINGELWGLYLHVEQVNKHFIEDRFGFGEDGNLFKGEPSGWLTWLGTDTTQYRLHYQLENNEEEDYWGDLIHFCDILNNTPQSHFVDSLEANFDPLNFLQFLSINTLLVNLDSYIGMGHNYYIYHYEDENRFVHIPWDLNESFGRFSLGLSPSQRINMNIFWTPSPWQPRPLVSRIFDVGIYKDIYINNIDQLVHTDFTSDTMFTRIDSLASLIQEHVYADPNKMYTNTQFELNIEEDIWEGGTLIFGLKPFVINRRQSVLNQLGFYSAYEPRMINEFMACNASTITDEYGEFDDWIEIYNDGVSPMPMNGWHLTDDFEEPTKYTFPDTVIPPESRLIVWADDQPEQGSFHASFKLSGGGEEIGLFEPNGIFLEDMVIFCEQYEDISYGRFPDGGFSWQIMEPTPESTNAGNSPPFIVGVDHYPIFPGINDTVTVTATITDSIGTVINTIAIVDTGAGFCQLEIFDDGFHGDGSEGDAVYGNFIEPQPAGTIVRFYIQAEDDSSAISLNPPSAPEETHGYEVSVNPLSLYINEFMAANDTTIPDPQGDFDDWVEIWNGGSVAINLGGMHLTDDLEEPDKWVFPDTMLALGAFLLVWADDDEGDPGLHTNFRLSANGEEIGLFDDEASGFILIDSITFGPQAQDVSYGRNPDGGPEWKTFIPSTPGFSNHTPSVPQIEDLTISIEGSTVRLAWNHVAMATSYKIYRSSEPYFTPSPENFLAEMTEPEYVDYGIVNVSHNTFYCVVVVVD
ncbi:MAG: CotH kinase family protein [candidate division Zixibacteria bacterium]|nr:CotH kinase family protein [Candidatus Tariuqbacter arcticus]